MAMNLTDATIAALENGRRLIHQGHIQRQGYAFIEGVEHFCAVSALAFSSHTLILEHCANDCRYNRDSCPHRISGKAIFDAGLAALTAVLPTGYATVAAYNDAATQREISSLYGYAMFAVQQAAKGAA